MISCQKKIHKSLQIDLLISFSTKCSILRYSFVSIKYDLTTMQKKLFKKLKNQEKNYFDK